MIDNRTYSAYYNKINTDTKKAKELHEQLLDLYGDTIIPTKLATKAFLDKLISKSEYDLLKQYC